ncbi:MAG: Fe-S cluster domain-containing protein [Oscillospiraceae bacterium]|nr:Fe-S cluster domain-containing protein [Oscillospiraceae bacterium]MCD8100545.1 Fe-S cluster domain-containing protein [Oscillospiraceae bacterium]MCD8191848.1 Fe-S cluster domain-containing protein [Oscillospiraceae bacterium]MCD8342775.1 Fe-S cluster domain-containing protein [Oscillospiraceae bacterium]
MIVIAVIVVVIIGLVCAVMLSVASKFMAVEVDERVPLVRECLPGANCGGCGYPGCDGYAAALVEDPDLPLTLCPPGGAAVVEKLSAVLGRSGGEIEAKVAHVRCGGVCGATNAKMDYQGISSCSAAKLLFGGTGKCVYGCMGLGDCAAVCPSDAVCIENGIAHIDARSCTGCAACVKACPSGIIELVPAAAKVTVDCSSREKGAATRKNCTAGCIGCKLCEKNCPQGAITVVDNLASIDYDKCDGCGKCASVCKPGCIIAG